MYVDENKLIKLWISDHDARVGNYWCPNDLAEDFPHAEILTAFVKEKEGKCLPHCV